MWLNSCFPKRGKSKNIKMDKLNSIEIADSDEDSPSEVGETMDPKRSATPSEAKAELAKEHTPKKTKAAKEPDSATSGPILSDSTSPSSSGTSPSSAADGKIGRHRARKSQLQAKRMSPTDLQFVTIPGEEGLEEPPAKQSKLEKDAAVKKEQVKASIAKLLANDETQELIKRIARERVRCNFLLATYQLPDMNFALNTQLETLCFQFRERIKQRRGNASPSKAASSHSSVGAASSASKVAGKGIVKARQPQP